MKRYEHRVDVLEVDSGITDYELVRWLDKLGEEGWHLTSSDIGSDDCRIKCVFARLISTVT